MIFEVRALIYVGMFGDADVADVAVARLAHVCTSQACVQPMDIGQAVPVRRHEGEPYAMALT